MLTADVRIIAATNVDLEEKIALKEFREDLYYRLNVIPISVAPLRARLDDLTDLCSRILDQIARERVSDPYTVSAEALATMQRYSWPGNVRQLENVLERASAFCSGGQIRENDLPDEIRGLPSLKSSGANRKAGAAAPRRLGIPEKSIYNKMTRLG
ncbi:MAG: sigma 54-interacting transcriptional regulator, partial [Verrucomicrobia bacterium]|nr:sigma 54-interacting transcriptional regulator [Verrucomicrobiota bacterium]